MGWQRFNRTTRVFEVSDDKGASWQILKIAVAGIDVVAPDLSDYARKSQPNTFAAANTFNSTVTVAGDLIVGGGSGLIGSARWYVGNDTNKADIITTLPVYPGRMDTGWTRQGQWYLGSHGNYGLYSNTGLYLEGYANVAYLESRAHVRSVGGLYDYFRGQPICVTISADVNSYISTPHLPKSGYIEYNFAGKMLFTACYFSGTVNTGAPNIGYYTYNMPDGVTAKIHGYFPISIYDTTGWTTGMGNFTLGSNAVLLYASNLRPWQSAQLVYMGFSVWIPIN